MRMPSRRPAERKRTRSLKSFADLRTASNAKFARVFLGLSESRRLSVVVAVLGASSCKIFQVFSRPICAHLPFDST